MIKSITLFSLLAVLAVSIIWTSSVVSQPTKSQQLGARSVFVRLSIDEEVTIIENGPLRLFVRCSFGPIGSPPFVGIIAEAVFTSSEDGWFIGGGPFNAGFELPIQIIDAQGRFGSGFGSSIAVSQGGRTIAFSPSALGVDVLGSDCVVVGQVITSLEVGSN